MGVQGRFSGTDLISPGHTPRGLRLGAGSLCVCGRGCVLTTPNTCALRPHPSTSGRFPSVCPEPGFIPLAPAPSSLPPSAGAARASCNTIVSNSETCNWRDQETEAQRGSHTLPGSQQIRADAWRVAGGFPSLAVSPALCLSLHHGQALPSWPPIPAPAHPPPTPSPHGLSFSELVVFGSTKVTPGP